MANKPDWVPQGVDTTRANTARVYDYLLGGTHNFLADQDAARAFIAIDPDARVFAQANRDFIGRAVRFLASAGIRQFLDIGSGIPTQQNVHQVVQQACRGARVAYVDIDPVAVAHSKAILAGNDDAAAVQGDLRDPRAILADPDVRRLLDPAQPTGLLLALVLHFVADEDDPWQMVATLRDALAPGSYLALAHSTVDGSNAGARAFQKMYNRNVSTSLHMRPRADILRFFDGFALVDPGLVYVSEWQPDSPEDVPTDPSRYGNLVGVARLS